MNRRISTWLRGRDLPWRPAAAVIAQVKAKDLGGYTDESVRAVRDALAAAEKVAADPDATQAEIDAALASLNAAVDGLKAKDDGDKPGAGDGKPGDGKPGKGDETKPDTGKKGGLSATGAGIVPIAAAALTLMAVGPSDGDFSSDGPIICSLRPRHARSA